MYEGMTDKAIAEELGSRVEQRRLEKNLSQQDVADEIGLSRVSYARLEKGMCKLENLIAALRVLDTLEALEHFIPPRTYSPIALMEAQGKRRKRATKKTNDGRQPDNDGELDW